MIPASVLPIFYVIYQYSGKHTFYDLRHVYLKGRNFPAKKLPCFFIFGQDSCEFLDGISKSVKFVTIYSWLNSQGT